MPYARFSYNEASTSRLLHWSFTLQYFAATCSKYNPPCTNDVLLSGIPPSKYVFFTWHSRTAVPHHQWTCPAYTFTRSVPEACRSNVTTFHIKERPQASSPIKPATAKHWPTTVATRHRQTNQMSAGQTRAAARLTGGQERKVVRSS